VQGKASKVRLLPVVDEDLRLELKRHVVDRRPEPDEYLLYPEKLGPEFYGGPVASSGRTAQLSSPARPYTTGGLAASRTRACRTGPCTRHTAITEFLRDTGNLKLAQMLAGHADIGTTANIYAHLDTSDLESALRQRNRK
jgi:integrase